MFWTFKMELEKGFGSRERAYYMGVNDYFGRRRTNRPHETTYYGPRKNKFELIITDRHIFLQKKYLIYDENWKKQIKN